MHDFAARVHAVIDSLDDTQKQQLLRVLIEDVRVTGWHVQIRLRIALDPPPPQPSHPTDLAIVTRGGYIHVAISGYFHLAIDLPTM